MTKPAIPVTIRGVHYSSQGQAARKLGVSRTGIYKALAADRLDYLGLGRNSNNAKAVEIDGVLYRSRVEAMKALNLTPRRFYTKYNSLLRQAQVRNRISEGKCPE